MDEESLLGKSFKWVMGATGLGAVASAVALPHPFGIIVALSIVVLFLLLFGGYFLWQRRRARRQREQFTTALEAQTAAAPKAISDPNQRASLDRVRQKFQTGLQEFKSRGKDIYKLPWYVIIGESGSGKTEAIRHSGIEFPPGLQDQLQGSGGTVNMDWWFTNLGIILDTAGSMIFNEARAGDSPEWREFLRLLKRARPHCPVNGLFLVLSVESLIKDSADTIAQKAARLAQQLDLIQRTLDVRFPVYMVVTKCDLLTGFREFFDNIDDPLLQHQMFGWSNPEPLDAHFRPDMVDQHLQSVVGRLRRRRMALIRDTSGTGRLGDTSQFFAASYQLGRGPAPSRRLDEVDALFALPESIMRLAPRLRRYLETIFVAGEWSAKPVFLRGIYFTSSMREGKALDEAIALATGLTLDQLPEERSWEKNRAFFLCDLFKEKVFRESGLVTRATNTLKLLRQRQLAIFGSAAAALLLLLVFSGFAYSSLKRSVLKEAAYWQAGAANWKQGLWSPAIVSDGPAEGFRFLYTATNLVSGQDKLSLTDYHRQLQQVVEKPLAVSWIFKPMAWVNAGSVRERAQAQRALFEGSVLKPLVRRTRAKMLAADPAPTSAAAMRRHRDALVALMELEADALTAPANGNAIADPAAASRCLRSFLSYLTEDDAAPETNLVPVFAWTYSKEALKQNDGVWPPRTLLGGSTLASNVAIKVGLEKFQKASLSAQTNVVQHLALVDALADKLYAYHTNEVAWLLSAAAADPCAGLNQVLAPAKNAADASWKALEASTNFPAGPLNSLAARYGALAAAASNASASVFITPVSKMALRLPTSASGSGLFREIQDYLKLLASGAADTVLADYNPRRSSVALLDATCIAPPTNSAIPACQFRWSLYSGACALATAKATPLPTDIGQGWKRYLDLNRLADQNRTNLAAYSGPLAVETVKLCNQIAADASQRVRTSYVEAYVKLVTGKLQELSQSSWTAETVTNAGNWLARVKTDLDAGKANGIPDPSLAAIGKALAEAKQAILGSIDQQLARTIGFPVVLSSPQTRALAELAALRSLLQGLVKELQNPIWEDCASRTALRANCDRYAAVLNALLKDDGSPAEWDLFFVPPQQDNDKTIIKVFRYMQVTCAGKASDWKELTSISDNLKLSPAVLTTDSALTIAYKKLASDPDPGVPGPKFTSWGLPGLIRDCAAERLDDGVRWRFHVRLEDGQQTSGNVTFEAVLKRPLPKREDWPGMK